MQINSSPYIVKAMVAMKCNGGVTNAWLSHCYTYCYTNLHSDYHGTVNALREVGQTVLGDCSLCDRQGVL